MEQITILFFALGSFFGIEGGRLAAEKTTITISPQQQQIEIVQEQLFTFVRVEKDGKTMVEQWYSILNQPKEERTWAVELEHFTTKNLEIKAIDGKQQAHLTFSYTDEKALRAMGIWYNAEKKQFSTNHVPSQHLTTPDGQLEGNYWVFDGSKSFSFTIEPFLELPEEYQAFKKPLEELLAQK